MKSRLSVVFAVLVFAVLPVSAKEVSSAKAKKIGRTLQNLMKGERKESIKEVIEEIARLDNEKVAKYLPAAATVIPSHDNYQAALEAVAKSRSKASIELLSEMLGRKRGDYRQNVFILEAFGLRKDSISRVAIEGQIDSKISHIQVAAIRAGRKRRISKIVPKLIDVVEQHQKVRDREYLEARIALIDLTGQDFKEIADWRKWWGNVAENFSAKRKKKGKSKTSIKLKKPEDAVEFFGEEVFSRNLLFVIDTSGSMTADSRIDRAKEQLAEAIKALKPRTLFNVIAYSDGVRTFQKSMQPASKGTVKKALKWATSLGAAGGTQTENALRKAFEDIRVDTIILLTDGAPSPRLGGGPRRGGGGGGGRGGQPDPSIAIKNILKWFKDANSTRKIRVDTFGFDGGAPAGGGGGQGGVNVFTKFLKDLAKMSGGKYRSID
ncbi:MAG: VWA domain-containing protein [Planctomycetota bacterium]